MPATTRKHYPCGHRGFGKHNCHRCEQADQMEAKAKLLEAAKSPDKAGTKKVGADEVKRLLDEAARLRAPAES